MRIILGLTKSDRAADYSSFDDGYRPGAEQEAVVLAVSDDDAFIDLTVEEWAEAAFVASNAPGPVAGEVPAATRLRAALSTLETRSLSVGDTVTVEEETVACTRAGWKPVEPAGTWTFCGHWDNDEIEIEYSVVGEVEDTRRDTGYWEQGLWADSASGPSEAVAAEIAIARYEKDD